MSYPFCRCWSQYSRTAVSYPSLFSRTCLLIPNEFGTVFELGVQRLETLQELEYNIYEKRVYACLLPFLCSPLHKNINSITISVHRTTVNICEGDSTAWCFDSYSNENKLGPTIESAIILKHCARRETIKNVSSGREPISIQSAIGRRTK